MTRKKQTEREHDARPPLPADEAELDDGIVADDVPAADPGAGPASPADADAESPDAEELLTRERDDYKDRWLRAMAEQDNVRKRARREIGDAQRFAVVDLVRELLEILDNFDRAAASVDVAGAGDDATGALRSGLELIQGRFREILEGRGLTAVSAQRGQPFDPAIHEAVLRIESDDVGSGEIVDVAQAGYRLEDIVLRPARVVVAQ